MTINEHAYLDLVEKVIEEGTLSNSRAGYTYSLPGQSVTFNLETAFPLITTRKMFTAGVLGELAAFVRGAEDLATFKQFGCNYWDANAANWAENKGKPKEEWRVGQSYGSLWRNFEGVDQLSNVLHELRADPTSRRHVISAWHPAAKACLPSCHIMFQFYVRYNKLHCHVYMRSVDLCVGLPSDVLLYGVLMHLVAQDCGMGVGTLTYAFGDAHVYVEHIDDFLNMQAKRVVFPGPKLLLNPEATTLTFHPADVEFVEYNCHPAIKYVFKA